MRLYNNSNNSDELVSENHDHSFPPIPTSLLSGSLPHSLSQGFEDHQTLLASRPRTPWAIQDSSLKHIPHYYPPLNRNCTTYVPNTAPSVVAIRIAECLRRRSIAAEYDDDSVSANAMTADRCHFQIQLWKGKVTPTIDFSDGVVVECSRLSGDTMSFHHACQAILSAASGESTGQDKRSIYQSQGMEFQRIVQSKAKRPKLMASPSSRMVGVGELEQIKELLKKDRLDCQQLAMERLIHLTAPDTTGEENATFISEEILQDSWIYDCIMPQDEEKKPVSRPSLIARSDSSHQTMCVNEIQHESKMRASALRVLTNALSVMSLDGNSNKLRSMLDSDSSPLIQTEFLNVLVDDLKGAGRPPSVVESDAKFASVHEAALAVRCIRILGEHSVKVKEFLQSDFVLDRLEMARTIGRATHAVLHEEAELIHTRLTEDARSC